MNLWPIIETRIRRFRWQSSKPPVKSSKLTTIILDHSTFLKNHSKTFHGKHFGTPKTTQPPKSTSNGCTRAPKGIRACSFHPFVPAKLPWLVIIIGTCFFFRADDYAQPFRDGDHLLSVFQLVNHTTIECWSLWCEIWDHWSLLEHVRDNNNTQKPYTHLDLSHCCCCSPINGRSRMWCNNLLFIHL